MAKQSYSIKGTNISNGDSVGNHIEQNVFMAHEILINELSEPSMRDASEAFCLRRSEGYEIYFQYLIKQSSGI